MIRQEHKCDFEKCRHNVHGVCCRSRFDLCKYYKATEIIKNLLILKKDQHGNTDIEWRVEVTEQAEQFLKEIEK